MALSTTVIGGASFQDLYGTASVTSVRSGGEQTSKSAGAVAISTTISNGGNEVVDSGGTTSNTIVSSGGMLTVSAGGIADPTTIFSGGVEVLGGTDLGARISGGEQDVYGAADGASVFGGTQIIEFRRHRLGRDDQGRRLLVLDSGGVLSGTTTVSSGGTIEFIGTDASNNGLKLLSGATGELASGAFLTDASISKGITLVILSGGIVSGGTILAGGLGILQAGGGVTSDGSGNPLSVGSGGTFEFLGTSAGANIKPASGATIEVGSGAAFAVDNINAGITVKVLSGATLTLSSGTISAGALVETLSGGTIIVSAVLADSGTLLASDLGSEVEIANGAVVGGGAVVVGNGIVDVLSGGTPMSPSFYRQRRAWIADTAGNASAFIGTVSGFGGINHANHKQFIDLVSVTSAPSLIGVGYTPGSRQRNANGLEQRSLWRVSS